MEGIHAPMRTETIVIGGGQAGLAVGYHLARAKRPFLILDDQERVGDVWRKRWDSLRMFSPAFVDGLPGFPFPAPAWSFPTKDEVADYLEEYARRFDLTVHTGVRVTRLSRAAERFVVEAGDTRYEADNVVIATGFDDTPKVPAFADRLDPSIIQLHSKEYRGPSQLRAGLVLVVGAGNSGTEIALDVSRTHRTQLSGRYRRMPVGPSRSLPLTAVLWQVISHVLTIDTPVGRKARRKLMPPKAPVERVTLKQLAAAGVERVGRVSGVQHGWPVLEDGQVLDPATVIWCTGFRTDLGWIELPIFDEAGEPVQRRGVVDGVPGMYFVGRFFQYAFNSSFIGGVGRDARYIAERIVRRATANDPVNDRSASAARTPAG